MRKILIFVVILLFGYFIYLGFSTYTASKGVENINESNKKAAESSENALGSAAQSPQK